MAELPGLMNRLIRESQNVFVHERQEIVITENRRRRLPIAKSAWQQLALYPGTTIQYAQP